MMPMSKTLHDIYTDRVRLGQITDDPSQESVLAELEDLRLRLLPAKRFALAAKSHQAKTNAANMGLYIWGDVGRGKSMLMDIFINAVSGGGARRVHFHAFLQEIHTKIHSCTQQGSKDAILDAVTNFSAGLRVLALDEMDVSDIADAMIVGRVFSHLFAQDTMVICTSNRPPDQLYRSGLNRSLFLPFIAMLEQKLHVTHLKGPQDWRQRYAMGGANYFAPLNAISAERFEDTWKSTNSSAEQFATISLHGRQIDVGICKNTALRSDFATLCKVALGAADYLKLSQKFQRVFLDNVPVLGPEQQDAARRFVMLVDALYESGAALVMRADAPWTNLIDPSLNHIGRERLISRLAQICSPAPA